MTATIVRGTMTHPDSRHPASRPDMLADLAQIVRDFTEPRHHTEIIEHREAVTSRTGRTGRTRSRLLRRQHITMLPSLLAALRIAAYPADLNDAFTAGVFESQPAANLAAISTLRRITDEAAAWCRHLNVTATTEKGQLARLVSAHHTDSQLTELLADARRWQHTAKMVVGEEEPLRTLDQPCPICGRKNTMVMRADGTHVRCARCRTDWTETQVGLLSVMLERNRQYGILPEAAARCAVRECARFGPHDRHADDRGRTWPLNQPPPVNPAPTPHAHGLPGDRDGA